MTWKEFILNLVKEPMTFGYVILFTTGILVFAISVGHVEEKTSFDVDKGWELLKLLTVAWTGVVGGVALGRHIERKESEGK